MRRGIHNLHIVGDDVFLEARGEVPSQPRLGIQEQFLRQSEDVQVSLHFALGGGDGGVAALAGAELFHVVGHLSVQEARPVGADKAEARAKAQIHYARRRVQGGMLGPPVAVVMNDLRSVPFSEPRAEAAVNFV